MGNGKVIAIGDYIKNLDNIVSFPVMMGNETVNVEIRIRKPMAEHSHKMMQVLIETFGDKLEELTNKGDVSDSIFSMEDKEDRKEAILFTWMHTATLISSCCYHPDRDATGQPVENPDLIWHSAEDVGQKCPDDLFKKLQEYLRGEDLESTIEEVEAKK